MTTTKKPITRETLRQVRVGGEFRALIIELHPHYLTLRPKGLRAHTYTVPYDAVWELGGKLQARREALEGRRPRRR